MKTVRFPGAVVLASMIAACGSARETVTAVESAAPVELLAVSDTVVGGTVATTLAEQVRVIATTASGKPAVGVAVSFTPADGNGTVAANPVRTDAQGIASASWTLGNTAGRQTLVAAVSGLPSVTFAATARSTTVARIIKVAGDSQSAVVATGPSVPPSVRTVDAFGNAVSGVPVDVTVKSGGGVLANARPVSDQNGIVSISGWSLGTRVGVNEIEVKLGTADPIRFTASGTAATADTVSFTPGDTLWIVATDSAAPRVRATDRFGNVASTASATFSVDDEGVARASGAYLVGRSAGVTTVRARIGNASSSRFVAVRGHLGAGAKVVHSIKVGSGAGAAISGDRILVGVTGLTVAIYDTAGTLIVGALKLPLFYGGVLGMTSAGARNVFVSSEYDDNAVIVDLATGSLTSTPVGFASWLTRPRLSPDGTTIYALGYAWLTRYDLSARRTTGESPYRGSIAMSDFAESDSFVLSASQDGQIDVLDRQTLARNRSVRLADPPYRIATVRNGAFLYAANSRTGSFDVYRTTDWTRVASVPANSNPRAMATSPDGLELYVVNDLSELRIFSLADPASPTFARTLLLREGFADAEIAFDELGTTMVVRGVSGNLAIVR